MQARYDAALEHHPQPLKAGDRVGWRRTFLETKRRSDRPWFYWAWYVRGTVARDPTTGVVDVAWDPRPDPQVQLRWVTFACRLARVGPDGEPL